jgi:hypothetical protein
MPNNTKFKYILGLWKTLPDYPSGEDLLYEIKTYLIKEKKPDGDFSIQTMNSIFGSGWKNTKHNEIIDELINKGEIIETKKSTADKIWYKIKK